MLKEVKEVADELNLSPSLVSKVYNSFWLFVRKSIIDLPLKEDLTKEEFDKLRTNFNIPNIGKLYCNYNRWKSIKQRQRYKENGIKNKKDKTNV